MSPIEICVTRGPSKGQCVALTAATPVTVGRAADNALVLQDSKVSSRHARLEVDGDEITVTDLGSKNGTFVSGRSVVGSKTVRNGDEIVVGNSVLEMRQPSGQRSFQIGAAPRTTIRAQIEAVRDLDLAQQADGGARNLTKAQRNLAVLHEVGALLSTERDEDRFLQRLMDLVFTMLPADRGALLLLDADGKPAARVTRVSDDASDGDIHVSRTILAKVVDGGMSILTADAGADARLASGASIIAHNIRSAMCVPIRGKRRTLGALYVDTMLSIGVFGKDDLHVLTTVGVVAGTGIENIRLFKRNLQQARMAAIGQVIAGLGHDIRNMLTALKGGIYMLDSQLREHADGDLREAWEVVKHGQDSIAGLVEDMVNYSKPREPQWQLSDINQVVLAAVAFTRDAARQKGIQITELVDPTIRLFHFDTQAIERCLMNLISNGIDAAPGGVGVVSVATEPSRAGDVVRIVVQDNGPGIPVEDRERVFDLLFSTKGSRGTGFGLAITRKLVEEHGGRVTLDSRPGEGARFTIELPLHEHAPAPVSTRA